MVQLLTILVEESKELLSADDSSFTFVEALEEDVGSDYLQLLTPGIEDPSSSDYCRKKSN